jgi:hypothetical protein
VIEDLAVNQHVTTFREIIPFELLAPDGVNDPTGAPMTLDATDIHYYKTYLDPIIQIFETYNVHLILAIGDPVPDWAAPWAVQANGNAYGCFLPPVTPVDDVTDMNTFKNNLSWSVGNYLNHLQMPVTLGGKGFGTWMSGSNSGGLWIEGWNEWTDNINYNTNCQAAHPVNTGATPQRAALLEGGISYVATYYGVEAKFAAPCVATVRHGAGNM